MGVYYATVDAVMRAVEISASADADAQIRRALESASRTIDGDVDGAGIIGRRFYPLVATRYFPVLSTRDPSTLSLGKEDLIAATTVTSGVTTIPAGTGGYFLRPQDGPPYTELVLDTGTYSTWPSPGVQGVGILGVWGYRADETAAAILNEALDASETDVDLTAPRDIGVGTILRIDAERMIVTDRTLVSTGQTLLTPVDAYNQDRSIAVTSGAAFTVGEVIVLDAESMIITSIAGNTLIVRRGWDGSALAAHTTPTIYAYRTFTVTRGALGTTAATHTTSTAVYRHVVPALAESLCIAETADILVQEGAAYARQASAGDGQTIALGGGLADIRERAVKAFGRRQQWIGV